jgi:hypothetical protein
VRIAIVLFSLALMPFRTLAVECSPSDKIKLVNAGYTKDEITNICDTAAPLFRSAVAVNVHTSLVNAVAQAMMPIEVPVAGLPDPLMLTEARYCGPPNGASSPHVAELVAIATSNPALATAVGRVFPSSALVPADCTVSLAQLASRFVPDRGSDAWAIAVRLEVRWEPWTLSTRVLDVRGARTGGGDPSQFNHQRAALLNDGKPLQSTAVRSTPVKVSPNSAEISVSHIFYFGAGRITIVAAPTEETAEITHIEQVPSLASIAGGHFDDVVGNVSVLLSHTAVNLASLRHLSTTSIPIDTSSPLGKLAVTRVRVEGGMDQYEIFGSAIDAGGKEFRARVKLRGPDLLIDSVGIEAVPRSCPTPSLTNLGEVVACLAENGTRLTLADGAGAAASSAFRGRPWTPYTRDQPIDIPWGSRAIRLHGSILHVTSDSEALMVHNYFEVERQ